MDHESATWPRVSIIISNYNDATGLAESLKSLMAQRYPDYEIIVVDANSIDGSQDVVCSGFPAVKLVTLARRVGTQAAINRGLSASTGDILIFHFNTDEIAEPDWLMNLVTALRAAPPRTLLGWARLLSDPGCLVDELGMRMGPLCQGIKRFHRRPFERCPQTGYLPTDYLNTFAFWRQAYEEFGQLDEGFFIYGGDADYSLRARSRGYSLFVTPIARTQHGVSGVTGRDPAFQFFDLRRGQFRLALKHYAQHMIPIAIPGFALLALFDLMLAAMGGTGVLPVRSSRLISMERSLSAARGSFKAFVWSLLHLRALLAARRAV
jgi:N-acetylglucosaminyl-diphospho-decaprenol L-rhamnosyltransferase